ncbi:hypothetical protein [Streptomyces sp. NPDC056401]|uniref:hypothetical protein n=1 Tax=Streptomyces sp. NPDC056401 TaxID=3345809 RepID=UPI0035DA14B0
MKAKVLSNLSHDGTQYTKGQTFEGDKEVVESLMAEGVLQDPEAAEAEKAQVSDDAKADAEAQASKIVAGAQAKADKLVEDAKKEAATVKADADAYAEKTRKEADADAEKTRKSVEDTMKAQAPADGNKAADAPKK